MTDNEIIKALECCKNKRCVSCPYDDVADKFAECSAKLVNDAHGLINRQKAEIERKDKQINELVSFQRFCERKAIEEFAERLKNRLCDIPQHHFTCGEVEFHIDKLVKEMSDGDGGS